MNESCANSCVPGARRRPHVASSFTDPVRLSRILRSSDAGTSSDALPLRRALMWVVAGVVLAMGIVLYFKYERHVVPLLT